MAFPKHEVRATDAFENDIDQAVAYYLEQSGPHSAERFLGNYDSFTRLVGSVPECGLKIGDTGLRWQPLSVFIVVYAIDDEDRQVMLLRLYYMTSNWRDRILHTGSAD